MKLSRLFIVFNAFLKNQNIIINILNMLLNDITNTQPIFILATANKQFNHLKYMTKFYEHIFPSKEEKQWPSHRVFTTSLYQEFELYSPSKNMFYLLQN